MNPKFVKNQVAVLREKAVESRLNDDLDSAKIYYYQAIDLDREDVSVLYELVGVYIEQDSIDKAFELLENVSIEQRQNGNYYGLKGTLYEYSGKWEQAISYYKKALKLRIMPVVKEEADLFALVDYALLETVSGQKELAVNRLNEALKLDWLTESNMDYIETFRNEIEYYQGNGFLEFDPQKDLLVMTTNPDSLKRIFKENHINISGSSSSNRNDTTFIYLSAKYKIGIDKLNLKTCPSNENDF